MILADFFNFNQLQYFHFLRPYWLLAFVALFIVLRFFGKRDDTLIMWRHVMSPTMLNTLTVKGNTSHWLSPQKLSLIILLPLCLILMGPTWQQQPSPFSEDEAILIIALDVSATMEQSDIQPNRLLRAKQKILQLLDKRGDAKTALVAFSGSAHVVMPITNDREMIRHFLDSLSSTLMPVSGKLPQSILPISQKLIASATVPSTILLITDSATQESSEAFSQSFTNGGALHNNQLVVWAIGKSAAQLSDGSNIIPMQVEQLQTLTNDSNGRLVFMSIDTQDIQQVHRYIENNLVIVDDKNRPWLDSGYPFTFVVAFMFLFWFRKGWALQW
ncbi:VWA domain-containing protein [Candidatus Colwellia aromaticivorans]|uniref:VWA domain-containing protein n=1 Tax=Candidatus Colwellia aromaticivorans TaxID=2267621 RepID=UPI000DF288F3|nr:VWA domain-containing protein [Candidatus Colwellia aromaticivorans]